MVKGTLSLKTFPCTFSRYPLTISQQCPYLPRVKRALRWPDQQSWSSPISLTFPHVKREVCAINLASPSILNFIIGRVLFIFFSFVNSVLVEFMHFPSIYQCRFTFYSTTCALIFLSGIEISCRKHSYCKHKSQLLLIHIKSRVLS